MTVVFLSLFLSRSRTAPDESPLTTAASAFLGRRTQPRTRPQKTMRKPPLSATLVSKLLLPATTVLTLCAWFNFCETARADNVYMFSYFVDNGTNGSDGLHLAYSFDGLSYHAVNGNVGIVKDAQSTPFMRDPYVNYTNGAFNLVYTTGWGGAIGSNPVISNIGYSSSTDLLHWATPTYKTLPITNGEERWAPQIYYDSANSQYMVYWSTRVGTSGYLNMYYSTTTDFSTFSTPTLLLARSGQHTLDGDIVKDGSNYVMFISGTAKSQGGTNLYGAYSTSTQQMTSGYSSEGPSAIKIGNTWVVYNDHYTTKMTGAVASTDDMATWSEYTGYVSFPGNNTSTDARHGNVFTVPYSVAQYLAANATNKPSEDEFVGSAGTSDFKTASNWFAGSVPGAGQTPVIQGGRTVNLTSSPSGAFTGLKVGQTSTGTLNIFGSSVVTMTSAWPNGLVLGERVTGNGAIAQSGTSSVTVNGFASIGTRGAGSYDLQSGSLTVTGDLNVGDILGAHGDLYQEGGTITAPSLFVASGFNDGFTSGNTIGNVHQSGGTMTITGSGDKVVIGGRDNAYGIATYALSGGTLDAGSNSSVLVGSNGQCTFTQSAGTLNARQLLAIGRYSGSSGAYSISGGTVSQTNASYPLYVGYAGAGTLTVSGSGLVDAAGGLRLSGASSASGEVFLNGGTIYTTIVDDGGGGASFHFNGGTLKAKASTTTFMQGLNAADVQSGGALIDTNGFNVTIAQQLAAGSPSGGLTKSGSGTLTLTANPTYTGDTVISAGKLQLSTATTTLSAVSGPGELIVGNGSTNTQLNATSINVGTLTLTAGSILTINAIPGGPTADSSAVIPVPEPSIPALLGIAAAIALTCARRKNDPTTKKSGKNGN
jgi:autotransporter-associated beta strand protein/T5SS/PEP-CTERM-associated repeat protein